MSVDNDFLEKENLEKTSKEENNNSKPVSNNDQILENTTLQDYKQKSEEYLDLLQRSQADFKNYKQRIEKETQDIIFIELSKMLFTFLSYRSTITKAITTEINNDAKEALIQLLTNFDNILKRQGIEKIEVLDTDFDFNFCDCILKQDVQKEKHNKVLEVIDDGFTLNKKLIKPAKVIVGVYKEKEGEQNE